MTGKLTGVGAGVLVCAVSATAALLIATALTGSWTWGMIATTTVASAFALVVAGIVRWARLNPDAAERLVAAWGRAGAFQSGGWERTSNQAPRDPNETR